MQAQCSEASFNNGHGIISSGFSDAAVCAGVLGERKITTHQIFLVDQKTVRRESRCYHLRNHKVGSFAGPCTVLGSWSFGEPWRHTVIIALYVRPVQRNQC
jgi:hypothetical protein